MRDYGARYSDLLPVVCLPGLARTAGDFDRLARRLSRHGRRVVALDYRGRGLSEWDPDWRRYDIPTESDDIQTVLTAAEIGQAIFIGTSRGGLHIMRLAAVRPSLLRAAILNDIGPVIEVAGLARIRGYVGKLPRPTSWPRAVDLFKEMFSRQFTAVDLSDLETYARLTFEERDGALVPRYDERLLLTLKALNLEEPFPQAWPRFEELAAIPLLAIRGANSDLLSAATLSAMEARHPHCETYVVPGQGHAPLLLDEPTLGRIEEFVEAVQPAPR